MSFHIQGFVGILITGFLLTSAAVGLAQQPAETRDSTVTAQPYFTEPALSPDRKEIAFVSGGDIWTVPATGGVASLLVSHPANEARPLYSPDGKQLAFVSTRTGNGDIYLLTLTSGELKRLSFDDAPESLDGWSRDARWIYFTSGSKDITAAGDIFRVSVLGGTPMQVSADRYTNEFFSALTEAKRQATRPWRWLGKRRHPAAT